MGYKVNNIVNTGGFPFYLIQELIKIIKVNNFIECGTAGGESIKVAAKMFPNAKCYTIEVMEDRATIDRTIENIEWVSGNTIEVLPKIIDELISDKEMMQGQDDVPIYNYSIFWLDAHWSEPYPNDTVYKECYILEELSIIEKCRDDAIIFIDDARLFLGHPPAPLNPKEWPPIQDIFVLLKEKFPYNYSTIVDDYIISIPERVRQVIDMEWRGNYKKRYPDYDESIRVQAKNVFKELNKYLNDIR